MSSHRNRVVVCALVSVLFADCARPEAEPPAPLDAAVVGSPADVASMERADLVAALERGETREVIVVLEDNRSAARTRAGSPSTRSALRALAPDGLVFEGTALPIVVMALHDTASLARVEATDGVVHVEPSRAHTRSVLPSLTQIGQPAALARGADGRNLAVAVLDTGADYTTADLGSCSAPGGTCPVVYARDFAADDGMRDDSGRHGTNVSSIVRAVAPSVRIVALDVFTGAAGYSSDIIAALDWVISNRTTYGIVAVNLSLGYGAFTAPCPSDAMAVALARVREVGIVPAVATGNSGYTSAISSPACAPAAVSVGALDTSGVVASFSNSASFASILAPGVSISAGGVVMSGTSQATPHVAGSVAAIATAYPNDDVTARIARLVGTGVATRDARNGLTLPRVNLDAATAGGATAPPPDVVAPTGTLALPAYTRTTAVTYTINASDPSGVATMCVSTSTTCTTFVAFGATGSVTLPTGSGVKTVRIWLRDGAGNTTSAPLSATTTLDTALPVTGALLATRGIGRVTLSIGASTDVGTGIGAYRVVFSTGTAAPTTCASGTALPNSTGTTFVHDGLVNGTTYRYRACAIDRAGNVSTGSTADASPAAELVPPTGTVVIERDAAWSRTSAVRLDLTASDASGVTGVCLATGATCTRWLAFSTPLTFTLDSGSGVRTVRAWFRDRWGNVATSPAVDTINVDTLAPADPVVTVARGDTRLDLSWPEGTDASGGSGLTGYLVSIAQGTAAPTNCAGGVSVAATSDGIRRFARTGLTNGTPYAYRVCALDVAGNVSAGRTGYAIPAPELVPPVGGVLIAGGAESTRTSSVSITLSASDASGVAAVCLSTTTTCTAYVTYATTVTFNLGTTGGTRTVRAWFKDVFGNVSASPATDTIFLDAIAPTNPRVTATPRSGAVELTVASTSDGTEGSGVADYRLSVGASSTTSGCASSTSVSASVPGTIRLPTTSSLAWRVCAVDRLGNTSSGRAGATVPLP